MIENKDIQKKIERIKKLVQYRNLSEEQLEIAAEKLLQEDELEETLSSLVTASEISIAKNFFNKYTIEYQIETSADKSTLFDLIYQEIMALRFKKFLSKVETETKNSSIYKDTIESLQKTVEMISKLKVLLGMTKKDFSKENSNLVKTNEELKRRFHAWINSPENRANYTLKCICGKILLIRRRLDKEKDDVLEHPFFIKGGILFNKHLWQMLYDKKITDEDAMKVLNLQSPDYLEWIKKHFALEISGEESNKVEEVDSEPVD